MVTPTNEQPNAEPPSAPPPPVTAPIASPGPPANLTPWWFSVALAFGLNLALAFFAGQYAGGKDAARVDERVATLQKEVDELRAHQIDPDNFTNLINRLETETTTLRNEVSAIKTNAINAGAFLQKHEGATADLTNALNRAINHFDMTAEQVGSLRERVATLEGKIESGKR